MRAVLGRGSVSPQYQPAGFDNTMFWRGQNITPHRPDNASFCMDALYKHLPSSSTDNYSRQTNGTGTGDQLVAGIRCNLDPQHIERSRTCLPQPHLSYQPIDPETLSLTSGKLSDHGPLMGGSPGQKDTVSGHRTKATGGEWANSPKSLHDFSREPPTKKPTKDNTLWHHCEVCNCSVNSDYQMKIHKEGVKHRKKVTMLQKKIFPVQFSAADYNMNFTETLPGNAPPASPPFSGAYISQPLTPNWSPVHAVISTSQSPVMATHWGHSLPVVRTSRSPVMRTGVAGPRKGMIRGQTYDSDEDYFSGSDNADTLSL